MLIQEYLLFKMIKLTELMLKQLTSPEFKTPRATCWAGIFIFLFLRGKLRFRDHLVKVRLLTGAEQDSLSDPTFNPVPLPSMLLPMVSWTI